MVTLVVVLTVQFRRQGSLGVALVRPIGCRFGWCVVTLEVAGLKSIRNVCFNENSWPRRGVFPILAAFIASLDFLSKFI